jgi:hypothetical protein
MPQQMGAVVTARGRVRTADEVKNRESGEVFGTRINILTEPMGGFLEVNVPREVMRLDEALALAGQDVEVLVSLGVFVSRRGEGYQQARAVQLRTVGEAEAQTFAQLRAV